MKHILAVAALLLLTVTGTSGLRCIACRPNNKIGGVTFPADLEDLIRRFPRCSQLNPKDPGLDYEMHCRSGLNSCVKIRDEFGNELRTCFPGSSTGCSKMPKKGQVLCKCRGDYCNSAVTSTPALISLFLPLVAALLRLH
ncbi:uncharacterized protein LOC122383140 [Amphibalanus amphitrite]|uniref:uncharacterized protein LOC122383140 n=1 Tax=Amphibalanus amphitrite TaxID=1232801 RepID=UPI001C92A1AF|nr:uncharacterized protein LOC122383140 [Amphibalanus amphitrite]